MIRLRRLAGAAIFAAAHLASAQTFPDKPLRFVEAARPGLFKRMFGAR